MTDDAMPGGSAGGTGETTGSNAGADGPAGDGELVVTGEAIDTIVEAYRQFASELRGIAQRFQQHYSREPWGTMRSIRQLQAGYEDLALGPEGSAVTRMREFADEAERIAAWVRAGGDAIMDTDRRTAAALSDAGAALDDVGAVAAAGIAGPAGTDASGTGPR